MYSFDTLASCVLQEEDERIKEFFHLLRKCWALRAPSPNSICLKISRIKARQLISNYLIFTLKGS